MLTFIRLSNRSVTSVRKTRSKATAEIARVVPQYPIISPINHMFPKAIDWLSYILVADRLDSMGVWLQLI